MTAMRLRSLPRQQQREQGADTSRRQRRQDRDRVDVALVKHAEHDVHRDDCRQDEQQRAVERGAERLGRALEARLDACGHAELALRLLDGGDGRAERRVRAEVERQRHRRELARVVDDERRVPLLDRRDARERNLAAVSAGDGSGAVSAGGGFGRRQRWRHESARARPAPSGTAAPPRAPRGIGSPACRSSRSAAGRTHRTAHRR